MKTQNLARSTQRVANFLRTLHEPIEAVVGGQTYYIWPAACFDSLGTLFASEKVHEQIRQSLKEAARGEFVAFSPARKKRSSTKASDSGKHSKP